MATESTSQLGRIEGYVIDVGAGGGTTRRRQRQTRGAEEDRNPVANAQINIHQSGYKPGTDPFRTVLTDANGYYFIDLPEGRYDLVCAAFSPTDQTRTVGVTAGQVVSPPEFKVQVGLQLTCKVQSPDRQTRVPSDQVTAGTPVILLAEYATPGQKPVTLSWKSNQGRFVQNPQCDAEHETVLLTEGAQGCVNVSVTLSETNGPQITRTASFNATPAAAQPISGQIGVTLQRADVPPTNDLALWVAIRNHAKTISFGGFSKGPPAFASGYQGFIDSVLCTGTRISPHNIIPPPKTDACGTAYGHAAEVGMLVTQSQQHPLFGMTAYELLKTATEVFLLLYCGVVIRDRDVLGNKDVLGKPIFSKDEELARLGLTDNIDFVQLLATYLGPGRLPYIQRIVQTAFPDELTIDSVFCTGILQSKVDCPCLIELIWSYWHEEGMLVQTLNAISRRFQNVRGPGDRDPLAHLEIDPLRPLNSLLWGYIQDERNRLTVKRRAYEYDHHYGLTLYGKAVPPLRPADSRSKFLEAFHNLLHRCSIFYKEDNDTTVIADGFPLLNALKEVHLLLAQGAHNQFGDLPWTARVEMLSQQWLLARPEIRDFLQSRAMVPYTEAWMPQVDTMKTLQGWSDVTVTHFRDLAVYGEQIVLTVRYGDWIDLTDENHAKNWARYWRPEIQGYIHAYRAATGVDLTRREAVDHTMPAVHLQKRLAMQRVR
jgi:hypothetical protein